MLNNTGQKSNRNRKYSNKMSSFDDDFDLEINYLLIEILKDGVEHFKYVSKKNRRQNEINY